jgi:ParB/RepB/Spo0J family partition protein
MINSTEYLKAGQAADVAISLIDPADKTFCLRKTFKSETIGQSLETLGQINPVLVKIKNDRLQIVAGWRRYQALKIAGAKTVKIEVTDKTDMDCRFVSLAENLDRQDMTASEKYQAIKALINDGAKTKDLMEKFDWCKSYAYAIKNISKFPAVAKAVEDGKFESISTAAELVEQLNGKKIATDNLVNRAIRKTTDGSWPVKDIGYYLKQEKEINDRQPGQPHLSKKLIENSGQKKETFKSDWNPAWGYFELKKEKGRFLAEIKKIDKAMKNKQ